MKTKSNKSKDKKSSKEKTSKSKKNSIKTEEQKDTSQTDIKPIESDINPTSNNNIIINNINNDNPSYKYYDQLISDNQKNNQNITNEKCNGCFNCEALIYCSDCKSNFCKVCDEQLHIIPALKNHTRIPIATNNINNNVNINDNNVFCYHHNNSPLKFYCETCEEPICQECQMLGPHNNKLHKILSIPDSFEKKFNEISNIISTILSEKYRNLMNNIKNLENLSINVKKDKNSMERNIRKKYEEMFENLNSVENSKLAVLNYETSNVNRDINNMNEMINYIKDLEESDSPDMIQFLIRYGEIKENIEYIENKNDNNNNNFGNNIDIDLSDFPVELEENVKKIENIEKMEKLIKFKDEIIWNLLKNGNKNKKEGILPVESKNEIEKWAKLSDNYANQLQRFNMICVFCGCFLDENNVNSKCERNYSDENNNFNNNEINEKYIGTERHFFVNVENKNKYNFNNNNDTNQSTQFNNTNNNFYYNNYNNNILI